MDFYDKILLEKSSRKLKNSELGLIIGMKGETFRMAIKRKSLNRFQIKEIEKYFDNETKNNHIEIPNNEINELKQENVFLKEKLKHKTEQVDMLKDQIGLLKFQIDSFLTVLKEESKEIKKIVETHFQYHKLMNELEESNKSIPKKNKK